MAAHVLMPQGHSLDATLLDVASGEELGDIVPWRSFDPAFVRPGLHSLNGSDYTHFTLSRWGAAAPNCTIDFYSTVVDNQDLIWLVESTGDDCQRLAVVFRALVKWGYSGSFQRSSQTTFIATLPGFPNVSVALVAGGTAAATEGSGGAELVEAGTDEAEFHVTGSNSRCRRGDELQEGGVKVVEGGRMLKRCQES